MASYKNLLGALGGGAFSAATLQQQLLTSASSSDYTAAISYWYDQTTDQYLDSGTKSVARKAKVAPAPKIDDPVAWLRGRVDEVCWRAA